MTITHPARSFTFDGVVRLTKVGVVFLLFTLVIGFAAINTGNNALYIALSFMLSALLLSGVASKGGLKHLSIDLKRMGEAWAGRPSSGLLTIANRSRIWNVRDVLIASDELALPVFVPLLSRGTSLTVEASFLFQHRGTVRLKRVDLYTRYPFGFFLKKRRVPIDGEVVVFPRLRDRETADERFRPVRGETQPSNRPGAGTEIHSFREYVPGDSLRHIYWKKSASLGRWITKQTEIDASRAVHVVIDPYKPRGTSQEDFEEMISEAATFIFDAVRRQLDVVAVFPRATMSARGGTPATPIYRALALLDPVYEPVAAEIDRDTVVFAVRREHDRATA